MELVTNERDGVPILNCDLCGGLVKELVYWNDHARKHTTCVCKSCVLKMLALFPGEPMRVQFAGDGNWYAVEPVAAVTSLDGGPKCSGDPNAGFGGVASYLANPTSEFPLNQVIYDNLPPEMPPPASPATWDGVLKGITTEVNWDDVLKGIATEVKIDGWSEGDKPFSNTMEGDEHGRAE